MNDIVSSQLAVMGFERFVEQEDLQVLFFKMIVSGHVGLIVLKEHDMTTANMALFKKMAEAFKAELTSSALPDFEYSYIWLLGADVANFASGNSLELGAWLKGEHMASGRKVFVYPSLTEIAANSEYKRLVWRSFLESGFSHC